MMQDTSNILDGKSLSKKILFTLHEKILDYHSKQNIFPKIAIIIVGNDEASDIYVSRKIKAAKSVNILTKLDAYSEDISTESLISHIQDLNKNPTVSAILVQLPLPEHIDALAVINAIEASKDVDGLHPINVGLLSNGSSQGFIPCAARACYEMIKYCQSDLTGKHTVIINRSNIIGKPLASLLLRDNCTVSICHSKTDNLSNITSTADIVVSAIGKAKFLTEEYFNNNAIIIDAGISRISIGDKYKILGDVDFDTVKHKAKYITPVPNSVGPMTIAFLLVNVFIAMQINHVKDKVK
ncbi:bifunctional 5,10-methylenetetrahydrofolate dehydrogenase/5,10-methenyltetrahydrofolate cyclohydrolase [Rickettsia endosymbiont of Cardiosporidium cionae]|uniref:bifunctional 5,10-methylenetetrahydrofolate dehydrogenase/5,10-methenyltetrahydrofolate cyclohydrolase n=1 Tax=Rickettsia endosymbiont of Cardiosporidium cionae TaxID=2777155 RepID=UPI001894D072|nr:bifunctional 5,10-methylenetetrahydrofolate dehydrogenase/5,10-methenyltetrahydrofolate cyclohydrolase [Rickettsia endosymbiont of Cardiosporidium cionae]KAF8818634.1 bifunctional methylenetetrahydrofolate dehydrogenase/methenyltetrahydrofolate cyclohydrolase FolD [Rickettsia endosymbiont of Cardiosporidium cionae]